MVRVTTTAVGPSALAHITPPRALPTKSHARCQAPREGTPQLKATSPEIAPPRWVAPGWRPRTRADVPGMLAPVLAAPASAELEAQVLRDAQRVANGDLAARSATFFWPSTRGTSSGVVLMLHGYTGGPWQFHSEAQRLNTAGLDVFCAPLPGHGALVDGGISSLALPRAGETQTYFAGAEAMFAAAANYAQAAGIPLHIYGLSLGGTLALRLTREHPQDVSRLAVIAPILNPASLGARVGYHVGQVAAGLTLGRWALQQIGTGWGVIAPSQNWPGHWNFSLSNLYTALDVGQRVLHDSRPIDVPMQAILSDYDATCDPVTTRAFLQRIASNCAITTFAREAEVIHPMVSAIENLNRGSREIVDGVATRFLALGEQNSAVHDHVPENIDLHPEQPVRRALAGRDTGI